MVSIATGLCAGEEGCVIGGWLGLSIRVWFSFLGGLMIGIGWGRLGARVRVRRRVWASGRG